MPGRFVGDDGARFLASDAVTALLAAAVSQAGGVLTNCRLDQLDRDPGVSSTAIFDASVAWQWGIRRELIGVTIRANGLNQRDEQAAIFATSEREAAVWLHPRDPDLPGLARAASSERLRDLLVDAGVLARIAEPSELKLRLINYRPRRRAVLSATWQRGQHAPRTWFVKVVRPGALGALVARHQLLTSARIPVPEVVAQSPRGVAVLTALPGKPLARTIFDAAGPACTAEAIIDLLDSLPTQAASLPARPPWSDAVAHYADVLAASLPDQRDRLTILHEEISSALAGSDAGTEATHGDFHEGQIHVAGGGVRGLTGRGGRIVGLLDVDTMGPGNRVDDLACLVAHLSTVQRMTPVQAERVRDLLASWVPVFDERVDAGELRLRAAGVAVSLATGPYRVREPRWQLETLRIIGVAEALVDQVW